MKMLPELFTRVLFRLALWIYFFVEASSAKNQSHPMDECIGNMISHINHYCTYPGKSTACFNGSVFYGGKLHELINVEGLALNCCLNMETCTRSDIQRKYCCSEPECLHRCYDIKPRRKFMPRIHRQHHDLKPEPIEEKKEILV